MASKYLNTLKSVEVVAETQSQFGSNQSGSATYTTLRALEGSVEAVLTPEVLSNDLVRQKKFQVQTPIASGRKISALKFNHYLYGLTASLSATIAPTIDDISIVMQTTMGGRVAQSGSAVASATTSGSFTVLASSGARFQPKQFVGKLNSSNKLEVRPIRSISTDTLNLHLMFSAVPSAGDNIYNSETFYPTETPTGSLQALVREHNPSGSWVISGLHGNQTYTLEYGKMPIVSHDLKGASWFSGSPAAASTQTYLQNKSPVFFDSEVYLYEIDASNPVFATKFECQSVQFETNFEWEDVVVAHGVNNLAGRERKSVTADKGLAMVTLKSYFQNLTHLQGLEQEKVYSCLIQIGSGLGKTVAIFIPRCSLVEVPFEGLGSLVGQSLKLIALHDTLSSGGTTELTEAPFVIGRL